VVLVTGHHAAADEFADWPAKIPTDATVVVYMPGYNYRSTSQQLLRAGVLGMTPCAIVSQATAPNEQIHVTTVDDLDTSPRLPSPTLLVVGEVVRLAKPAALHQQLGWPSNFASAGSISSTGQERAE
jgi:uroporphyrin-III C-methyltransferase